VILFRCFPWDTGVTATARGGALWFPRMLQGAGRHDNPDLYGCLYVSETEVSALVERLQGFRGTSLEESDLRSRGLPLALAGLELPDAAEVVDLDQPRVLERERLRPSRVATNDRSVTQEGAAGIYERHEAAAGIRWWSTFEALWANVTLFDRAEPTVTVGDVRPLGLGDDAVGEAAAFLGLQIPT
jgi:hypothetical protein